MNNVVYKIASVAILLVFCGLPVWGLSRTYGPADSTADDILEATGVKGGLVVHLGCDTGVLTASLLANDSYLVHGLDTDAENVEIARKYIHEEELYGKVSVEQFTGTVLPYSENLVNLIVAEDMGDIRRKELMRVLAPDGVAYIKQPGGWEKIVKHRPDEIDEWTHYLYDTSNNAVSADETVDLPYHIQWVGAPRWARSHDHLASTSAVVSSGGRIFSINDEAPAAAVALPAKWMLVGRDAFSGVVLWKRQIGLWEGHLRGFRTGPPELPRRLVAIDDRVYVTLGYGRPVTCLDAATGKTLKTYRGTSDTLEILYRDGVLFLVTGEIDLKEVAKRRGESPAPVGKRLMAVDAESGKTLWKNSGRDVEELMPLTLAVSDAGVFYQNPDNVICLDAGTGAERWRTPRPIQRERWAWSTPTLTVYGDVVLSADKAARDENDDTPDPDKLEWKVSSMGGDAPPGEIIAFSAKNGRELWRADCRENYNSPPDVLVTDGKVWMGDLVRARNSGITQALDVATGAVAMKRPKDQEFFDFGMGHHRCYRNKATEKYLLLGRSGIEFIDTSTGAAVANHFTRGACQYGIMPGNGLVYAPPHSCACFIEAKINGFNALAPKRAPLPAVGKRLSRGPAFNKVTAGSGSKTDWPTYRNDAARSGYTPYSTSSDLKKVWQTKLGGKLTSPVTAGGMVFLASVDEHTVHAMDAANGGLVWSHTVGGRVDSPPTIHNDLALFGSSDGYVYCLRASDGELVWRFRASPRDRRIVAYGQLESAWPVSGSVLVLEEKGRSVAYVAAGRTSYLDGGIYLHRLDAKTGEHLSETVVSNRDPKTGLPEQRNAKGTQMPGALPDVLSSDGENVYMRHTRFSLDGREQSPDVPHLFSPAGFLDDAWWHRTYWIFGTKMSSGWGGWTRAGYQVPAGRLLVTDDSLIYGFGRLNQYAKHGAHVGVPEPLLPWPHADRDNRARGVTHYELFACSKAPFKGPDAPDASKRRGRNKSDDEQKIESLWSTRLGLTARAMVLADRTLFVAGPPEVLAISGIDAPLPNLAQAEKAYAGKKGALLQAVSADDGNTLAEYRLDSPPVLDGIIAAEHRLYIVTIDGKVTCMGKGV